jgi:hypothetical protein
MTCYKDLEPYEYWSTGKISEILNVGWLGKAEQFAKGTVSEDILKKLEKVLLSGNENKCQVIVNRMRGFFDCEFCDAHSYDLRIQDGKYMLLLGNAELLIPQHSRSGYYFNAPTLIHHYITAHHYKPPQEFLDSLVELDLNKEFEGNTIFKNLVEKRGGTYIH